VLIKFNCLFFLNNQFPKHPAFKFKKKNDFLINKKNCKMGFYFRTKKSLGILEIEDSKKILHFNYAN